MDLTVVLVIAVVSVTGVAMAVRGWRRRPSPIPSTEGLTFVHVGDTVHVLDGAPILEVTDQRVRLVHPAGVRIERTATADEASIRVGGEDHALTGGLRLAQVTLQREDGPLVLLGIRAEVVHPPEGRIVFLRTAFVGTHDEAIGRKIIEAFQPTETPAADAAIPWTLEGATRYGARYLEARGAIIEDSAPVGTIALEFPDGEAGQVHLANVFLNLMQGRDPTEAREALEGFLDSAMPMSSELQPAQLLPRLSWGQPPITFGEVDGPAEISSHPVGTDLCVLYVQDLPSSMRYLTVADAERVEPDDHARLELARDNLARAIEQIRVAGDGPVYMVLCGGNYEASLILLPELWAFLDPLLDGPRLIAVPTRDLLFVTGDTGSERREQLLALANPEADLAYRISNGIYRWTDEGDSGSWQRVDASPVRLV